MARPHGIGTAAATRRWIMSLNAAMSMVAGIAGSVSNLCPPGSLNETAGWSAYRALNVAALRSTSSFGLDSAEALDVPMCARPRRRVSVEVVVPRHRLECHQHGSIRRTYAEEFHIAWHNQGRATRWKARDVWERPPPHTLPINQRSSTRRRETT